MMSRVASSMPSLGKLAMFGRSGGASDGDGGSSSEGSASDCSGYGARVLKRHKQEGEEASELHLGDLLEHSWHYDCVVSPKSSQKHAKLRHGDPGLGLGLGFQGSGASAPASAPASASSDSASDSASASASSAIAMASSLEDLPPRKPFAHIIQYPSSSSHGGHGHSCGYISLSAFIKTSST